MVILSFFTKTALVGICYNRWRESLLSLPKKLLSGTSLVHVNSTTDSTETCMEGKMGYPGTLVPHLAHQEGSSHLLILLINSISFPVVKPIRKSKDSGGQPKKPFEGCTDGIKRRKTEDPWKQPEPSELAFAAQVEYRARGEVKISNIMKDTVLRGADNRMTKKNCHETLAAQKAPSLVIEA
ncbi:unnamed protein product [Callosobruchus maculatus]|uniref:Uncharacterized protein n=1 Tax=Callosobruchus maculatus TaxID=64391 RepID=A0A653DEG1_CALMS|nr:unnamed protein product [Callosobruchus maculatus]